MSPLATKRKDNRKSGPSELNLECWISHARFVICIIWIFSFVTLLQFDWDAQKSWSFCQLSQWVTSRATLLLKTLGWISQFWVLEFFSWGLWFLWLEFCSSVTLLLVHFSGAVRFLNNRSGFRLEFYPGAKPRHVRCLCEYLCLITKI